MDLLEANDVGWWVFFGVVYLVRGRGMRHLYSELGVVVDAFGAHGCVVCVVLALVTVDEDILDVAVSSLDLGWCELDISVAIGVTISSCRIRSTVILHLYLLL